MCRQRAASKAQGDGARKNRHRERSNRALPAPEANAELQSNVDVSTSQLNNFSFCSTVTRIRLLLGIYNEYSCYKLVLRRTLVYVRM